MKKLSRRRGSTAVKAGATLAAATLCAAGLATGTAHADDPCLIPQSRTVDLKTDGILKHQVGHITYSIYTCKDANGNLTPQTRVEARAYRDALAWFNSVTFQAPTYNVVDTSPTARTTDVTVPFTYCYGPSPWQIGGICQDTEVKATVTATPSGEPYIFAQSQDPAFATYNE